jgi:2-polyprenyl-6-methoxyphenol hydroxylase-like FAD-dependent oxidoreductase
VNARTVLISGASIAGPALAYWLRRHGFEPTVVERAPAPRPGGQGIDLRGTARTVVERMGLMERIRARHTGVHAMAQVDASGKRLYTFGGDVLGDSGGIIADIEILRGDLVEILHDATRADVEYVFDDWITSLAQGNDGVAVTFARSAPRKFDLVVGADGARSAVRRLAFGPHEEFLSDGGYQLSVFATPTLTDLGGEELMHNMPAGSGVGGRMAGLYPTADPAVARGMLFFACDPLRYDRRDVATQKRLVAGAFTDGGWLVPRMVESMLVADDFYFARSTRVKVDEWSRGRAVLLGDSVFGGSVGMGTSMAIVGAYLLAGELAAAQGDHVRAFAAYQQRMAEYVRKCSRPMPGGTKGMLPSTRLGLGIRNVSTRLLLAGPWRVAVTGGLQKIANMITLPDYGLAVQPTR